MILQFLVEETAVGCQTGRNVSNVNKQDYGPVAVKEKVRFYHGNKIATFLI